MTPPQTARIANLDVVRAIAIALVVLYHAIQSMHFGLPKLNRLAGCGALGVDLFFVLSGFLIGGLYWMECKAFGRINRARFIIRRILRTVPPYLVMLALAFLAVHVERGEPFDWGYLFFLQNYYQKLPFFIISWSLCVEEHFYLLAPIILPLLVGSGRNRRTIPMLLGISLLPVVLRAMNSSGPGETGLGFATTATHFRFDGLVLGMLASYIYHHCPPGVSAIMALKWPVYFASAIFLVATSFLPPTLMYVWGYYMLAALFATGILIAAMDSDSTASRNPIVRSIAVASYGTYLTHALAIHAVLKAANAIGFESKPPLLLITVLSVFICGYLFYIVVEKPTLGARHAWCPSALATGTHGAQQ